MEIVCTYQVFHMRQLFNRHLLIRLFISCRDDRAVSAFTDQLDSFVFGRELEVNAMEVCAVVAGDLRCYGNTLCLLRRHCVVLIRWLA